MVTGAAQDWSLPRELERATLWPKVSIFLDILILPEPDMMLM